jgi:hypothetical protein
MLCTNKLHLIITKVTSSTMFVCDCEMCSQSDGGAVMRLICMPLVFKAFHAELGKAIPSNSIVSLGWH